MPVPEQPVSPAQRADVALAASRDPRAVYGALRARAEAAARDAGRRANRLGVARLVSFVALVAAVVLLGLEVHPAAGIAAAVLGLAGFNQLVGRQQAAERERARQQRIGELAGGELASVDYDFSAFDGGHDLRDPAHPYTGDLDVFGERSAFQLLNRTATLVGRAALAHYLRFPLAAAADVVLRRDAVDELAADPEWRLGFLAAGARTPASPHPLDRLRAWASAPPRLTASWWPLAIWGLSLFNVLWLASFAYLPFYVALLGFAPTAYLLYRARPEVDDVHRQTEEAVELLAGYRAMIEQVERRTWSSPLLRVLAEAFGAQSQPASRALDRLGADARQLALRVNPFVLLLNLFSFWEIRYARRLEAWKAEILSGSRPSSDPAAAAAFRLPTGIADANPMSSPLDGWLTALGAFDALASFAAARYRYPAWVWPAVSDGDEAIAGRGLHHPLLPPARSVANDFASPARAHIHLLTGSNMAGKSTFLRTVGLHLAMAQWGCPVPAASLRLPILSVYTSMRTQDDLHEGASAFYAELQRLRFVVEATGRGERVFFLLDEILKGTNSHDRHAGGRALIEQLIRKGGAGIVATHDLELGAMAGESDAVENLRLEVSTNAAGELYFDYTVKPGLAESRNASILMEQMGLGVDADDAG